MRSNWKLEPFEAKGTLSVEEKNLVEITLAEILESHPFRTSRQCQDLLRYIVQHSLAGEEESLRERVIGVEVFGRKPDYDQASDPVVRIRASDIRKRLALYYAQTTEGAAPVKITIPCGSYKAGFVISWTDAPETKEEQRPTPEPTEGFIPFGSKIVIQNPAQPKKAPLFEESKDKSQKRFPRLLLPIATTILLLVIATFAALTTPRQTAIKRFWAPVIQDSHNSLIYAGGNTLYMLSPGYISKYRSDHRNSTQDAAERDREPILRHEDTVHGDDIIRLADTYVSIGDVAASAKIASYLSVEKKAYDMRFNQDISMGDLRQGPVILIGAFNNPWTLKLTDNLRFVFGPGLQIRDRFDPRRTWRPGQGATEDFAVVSRVLNSKTGQTIITAAGLGQAGTWAAGEFLTSPKSIEAVAMEAPKGWESKNTQIILHTTIINGSPSAPEVVAVSYW